MNINPRFENWQHAWNYWNKALSNIEEKIKFYLKERAEIKAKIKHLENMEK